MIWRSHLKDTALLYSLLEDLQLFWQYKALEWEKLERRITQSLQEAQRTDMRVEGTAEGKLREILEHNNDYRELRDRISIELMEARSIAHFLGYTHLNGLQGLNFDRPLPDNPLLEAAINDVDKVARYCQRTSYWWHFPLGGVRALFTWLER